MDGVTRQELYGALADQLDRGANMTDPDELVTVVEQVVPESSPQDPTVLLHSIVRTAARTLLAVGAEGEGRRLRDVPINPQARYSCLLRVLPALDTALRIRWGARDQLRPDSPIGHALESVELARLATTAVLGASVPETGWLQVLLARCRLLAGRAGVTSHSTA